MKWLSFVLLLPGEMYENYKCADGYAAEFISHGRKEWKTGL